MITTILVKRTIMLMTIDVEKTLYHNVYKRDWHRPIAHVTAGDTTFKVNLQLAWEYCGGLAYVVNIH